jgi:HemY protein
MLMAELERTEHGDSGKARTWTLRAVRARHDPAWTADGYVSDRWRPVSPVTGRLDAFQWQTPVASLPSSDKGAVIETSPFEEAMLAAPSRKSEIASGEGLAEPPEASAAPAAQDNSPSPKPAENSAEPVVTLPPPSAPAPAATAPPPEAVPAAPAPMFRARTDLTKPAAAPIPAVIPIIRAPDDPGIDDEAPSDEFTEQIGTPKAQAGGWRGFWARWGG